MGAIAQLFGRPEVQTSYRFLNVPFFLLSEATNGMRDFSLHDVASHVGFVSEFMIKAGLPWTEDDIVAIITHNAYEASASVILALGEALRCSDRIWERFACTIIRKEAASETWSSNRKVLSVLEAVRRRHVSLSSPEKNKGLVDALFEGARERGTLSFLQKMLSVLSWKPIRFFAVAHEKGWSPSSFSVKDSLDRELFAALYAEHVARTGYTLDEVRKELVEHWLEKDSWVMMDTLVEAVELEFDFVCSHGFVFNALCIKDFHLFLQKLVLFCPYKLETPYIEGTIRKVLEESKTLGNVAELIGLLTKSGIAL